MRREIRTITTIDHADEDTLCMIVCYWQPYIRVCFSKRRDGDIDIEIDAADCEELIAALSEALRCARGNDRQTPSPNAEQRG